MRASISLGWLLASAAAYAQAAEDQNQEEGAGAEIVVTATRRSESAQNIPLSITAMTSESLEKKAATSFFDYGSSVPNLSFGNTGLGVSSSRAIAIRGIADRDTTGFYIDDTPVTESLDPKIVDVERIEVLRGPQGTLYGARSMGGTVRLITTQPSTTELEGRAHASLSTTDHTDRPNYSIDGAINIPLVKDRIGLRVVGVREYDAGYFKRAYGPAGGDVTTHDDIGRTITNGASAAMKIDLTDNLSLTPRLLYQETKANGFPFADVAITGGDQPQTLRQTSYVQRRTFDVPESSRDKWLLATFDAKLRESFGTFNSATSYFRRRSHDIEDITDFIAFAYGISPLPAPAEYAPRVNSFTQEFRFVSDFQGPFQIVAGLFYSRTANDRYFPPNIIPGLDAANGGIFGTDLNYTTLTAVVQKDYSAYTEATLEVLPHLKAIAGARVFKVKTSSITNSDGIVVGGPTTVPFQTQTENGVQPKFSLQYQISSGNQVYATVAKGFRPGGVNGVIPTGFGCGEDLTELGLTPEETIFYKSDRVWSYELGAKTTWFDHRMTANVGAFRIDWDGIQQQIGLQCGFSFRGNAGHARSQGVELEVTARPIQNLTMNFGLGYTDAKFRGSAPGTQFHNGDRVPQVPRYTLSMGADYSVPISGDTKAFGHVDYRYVGDSTSVLNSGTDANGLLVPRIRPSYNIVDLRGGIDFARTEVALFVKNLTNEQAVLGDALSLAAELPGRARISVSQPRTIGIEVRTRF